MTYNEKIGAIKCTYAEIFDQKGNKIFSVQKKKLGDKTFAVVQGGYVNGRGLPVVLTEETLASINDCLKRRKRHHFENEKYKPLTGLVYINPEAVEWQRVDVNTDPDYVDPVPEKKSGLGVGIVAAGAVLLLLLFSKRKKA